MRPLGYETALYLQRVLFNESLCRFERITEDIESAALDIFWRYRDKSWGIVDCASLVVMELMECNRAFAYDGHFREAAKQYGFRVEG